jgi:hypothetical protein
MKTLNLVLGTISIIVGAMFLLIAVNPPLMTLSSADMAGRNFIAFLLAGSAFMAIASVFLFVGRERVPGQTGKTLQNA